MSMIDFPKIDSQGFFHDWNGFAMDRFNDPHLPSAGFTRRGVKNGLRHHLPLRGGLCAGEACLIIAVKGYDVAKAKSKEDADC
jgi:hypothetical protein